jgi:hypothetical protein
MTAWPPAAVVISWLVAFFVGADEQTAAELAQMKGQTPQPSTTLAEFGD